MITVSYICKNGIAHSLKTNVLFSHPKCWEFEPSQVSVKIFLLLFWKKEGYYFIDNSSIKSTYLRLPIGMARITNALYKPVSDTTWTKASLFSYFSPRFCTHSLKLFPVSSMALILPAARKKTFHLPV